METASFQPTADDLLAGNRLFYRTSLRSWRVARAFLLGGAVFAAVFLSCVWGQGLIVMAFTAIGGVVGWAVALGVILLGNYLQLPRRVRRIYAQQKALHDGVEVTWSEAGITITSSRGGGTFNWSDFLRMHRDDHVVILLQSEALFNFIPIRALTAQQADNIEACYTKARGS